MISIHALREEGDSVLSLNFDFFDISIHALREEGDPSSAVRFWLQKVFLSTPSARRATPDSRRAERGLAHFYPRPPRGGRPVMQDGLTRYVKFLSTPSARRATPRGKQATESTAISIHALREEGDVMQSFTKKYCFQFLSTPSARRATFKPEQSSVLQGLFLSTPSARRATRRRPRQRPVGRISIHALREEGDEPAAEAPAPTGISIHALREEGDGTFAGLLTCPRYFYPRPPRGGRPLLSMTSV